MNRCKIIIRDGLQMIVHPNGNEIPKLISTKVYQNLTYPPVVEVELYTDERIQGGVKYLEKALRDKDTKSHFIMPTGEPIPGIDRSTIEQIEGDVDRFRFLMACEF